MLNKKGNKMKKIILLIGLFVSIISVLSLVEAEASCESPYQSDTVSIMYGNCNVIVHYCYYCSAAGVGFDIQIDSYDIPNNCIDSVLQNIDDFKEAVRLKILKDIMTVPGCIKPCTDEGWHLHTSTVIEMQCIKLVNDVPNAMFHLVTCEGSAYCHLMYKVCVNFDENNEPILNYTPDGSFVSPGDCAFLEIPPILENPPDGWESECFVWGTCGF